MPLIATHCHAQGVWLNSNMPDFYIPLPHHHVLEVPPPAHSADLPRTVGFLGFCIGGGAFATMYREGAFGGAAATMVCACPCLSAHVCMSMSVPVHGECAQSVATSTCM